jgi:hypothetical protein
MENINEIRHWDCITTYSPGYICGVGNRVYELKKFDSDNNPILSSIDEFPIDYLNKWKQIKGNK